MIRTSSTFTASQWLAIILLIGMSSFSSADSSVNSAAKTEEPKSELPLNEIRVFVDIFDRIKKAYVEEVDDRTLLENAIKGMLSELDPHSAYLEPEAFKDLQISTTGEFGGLGIEVGMEDGFVKVITPIDDTPAQKAGVMAGDLIIKLDDQLVKGLTLSEAVALMRGKAGAPILLTVIRDGHSQPIEIEVIRDIIQVKSVRSNSIEDGYGYVRITQFQVHTGKDLNNAIKNLNTKDKPLSGLVLDLRNNPGGVLQAAVDVSDTFMDEGLVVYTNGRLPNSEMRFNAAPGDKLNGLPLVVLVNGGSASASEIVAGALQDHKRAIIMGTNTFGKGSVQTVLPLHNERALKLTTARYYTPKGSSIQAQGIIPDIIVDAAKITRLDNRNDHFREADLRGHLVNSNGKSEKRGDKKKKKGKETSEPKSLAERDYQLYEALNLLKGLNIAKHATASITISTPSINEGITGGMKAAEPTVIKTEPTNVDDSK
ncbi:MAG: S41 family peptidase [Pseudomonadales bacterium]|nr:S41 family peptidase [Pseudomonadales bacterium]